MNTDVNRNERSSRPQTRSQRSPPQRSFPVSRPESSPETSASPPPSHPPAGGPPSDPKPRHRAEFFISIKTDARKKRRVRQRVIGDTGCTRSAMSEEFFLSSPHLKSRPYRPMTTRGTAINGSKVMTLGIVNVAFRVGNRFHTANFRVVRGLVQDIFLGWDWFSRSGAMINPDKGTVDFPRYGDSVPLVPESFGVSGCYYRSNEDFVVPANSKMICNVEVMLNGLDGVSNVVATDPFNNASSDLWASRNVSIVRDGMFATEFINSQEYPIKVEKGRILGYAQFTSEEELTEHTIRTELFCHYGPEPTEEHNPPESEDQEDQEEIEEIVCDPPPTGSPDRFSTASCDPQDTPPPGADGPQGKPDLPPGAKKLKLNWSKLSKDAQPYKAKLKQLLEVDHANAFSKHDRDYGKTNLIQYRANLKDKDQQPIAVPAYRTRPEMREVIDNQTYQMIADGIIAPSTSPFSAPIILARKKCGGWRYLTDFRKINERCNKVVYPLPRIEDSLQKLDNPRFFTSLDLTKGFWQIPIHPEERKYFAFSTENMHLEYLVAPMGAKNAPSALSALMQLVLRGLPPQHVISYLDDILVASNNMEDHIYFLDQVLSAVERAGLKLNPAKCSVAQDSVVCLGHLLSKDGVAPDPANIAKIKAWTAPSNARKLKTFLGLTGYYRQFVRDYSKIAQPLTELTRDGVPWAWNKEHQSAFDELQRILVSNQVMNYPDFSKQFCIKSDASLSAIGYVLTQEFDGKEKVISYGSKKLSPPQRRWSTYDREFFALLCGVRANSHYLRHAPFIAVTDHRPLLAWRKVDPKKDPTGRRTRWAIELDTYEFDLVYKKGKIHADADAMSRLGDDNDEEASDDADNTYFLLGMLREDENSAVWLNASKEGMDKLRAEQDKDCIVSEAKKFVQARRRIPKNFPERWYTVNSMWFVVHKGILYKKAYSEAIHSQILQAVIPESMTQEVMGGLHGDYLAGHPCPKKMLLTLKRYSVWPTIARDVDRFVKDCKVCDQEREPTPHNQAPRVPLEAQNVWDWVVCDLLKLPPSAGYQYVLVFMDVFSGFVKLYKLRSKNTEGVCKAFENLTCLIGPPRLLTSDNGGEFTSGLLESMCKVKGADKRTSVAYRPQSQGTVERFNRTLIQSLRKRLLQHGKTWVDHLQYAEWAYNTTPRSNDKMSPYLLMYGREPPLPTFVDVDASSVTDRKLQKYFQGVKTRTKEVYDEARRRIILARKKDVDASDQKVKHTPLSEGTKVYERVPDGLRNKLQPKWDNPMTVVKRRPSPSGGSGITYECRRDDGSHCTRNFEQLKPIRAKESQKLTLPPQAPVSLDPVSSEYDDSDEDDLDWTMILSTPAAPSATLAPLAVPLGSPTPAIPAPSPPRSPLHHSDPTSSAMPVGETVSTSGPEHSTGGDTAPSVIERATTVGAHTLEESTTHSPSEVHPIAHDSTAGELPTPPVRPRPPPPTVDDALAAPSGATWGAPEGRATPALRSSSTAQSPLDVFQFGPMCSTDARPTHVNAFPDSLPAGRADEEVDSDEAAYAAAPDARDSVTRQSRKASVNAMSKIKWYSAMGTRKAKQVRERTESMKRSTGKLLSTSRQLVENDSLLDDQTDGTDGMAIPEQIVGDFSSHDLIRNRIAEPFAFNDPPQGPSNNELIHVPATLPSSSAAEQTSSWSSMLNPFSYYMQRTENPEKTTDPDSMTRKPECATGRIESIDEEILSTPQCASTPN